MTAFGAARLSGKACALEFKFVFHLQLAQQKDDRVTDEVEQINASAV